MKEPHDLAAAYALDALTNEERTAYETHLSGCAECQAEVAELELTVSAMGGSERVEPPAGLRAAVLAKVESAPQEGTAAKTAVRLPQPRWLVPSLAVAATVSAVVAIGLAIALGSANDRLGDAEEIAAVLALPDTRASELDGPPGTTARLVYSDDTGRGALIMSGVADAPGDATYQLWLITGSEALPGELFAPVEGSVTLTVVGDFAAADAVGVTIEPAGGSEQPTSEVLFVGPLIRESRA